MNIYINGQEFTTRDDAQKWVFNEGIKAAACGNEKRSASMVYAMEMLYRGATKIDTTARAAFRPKPFSMEYNGCMKAPENIAIIIVRELGVAYENARSFIKEQIYWMLTNLKECNKQGMYIAIEMAWCDHIGIWNNKLVDFVNRELDKLVDNEVITED